MSRLRSIDLTERGAPLPARTRGGPDRTASRVPRFFYNLADMYNRGHVHRDSVYDERIYMDPELLSTGMLQSSWEKRNSVEPLFGQHSERLDAERLQSAVVYMHECAAPILGQVHSGMEEYTTGKRVPRLVVEVEMALKGYEGANRWDSIHWLARENISIAMMYFAFGIINRSIASLMERYPVYLTYLDRKLTAYGVSRDDMAYLFIGINDWMIAEGQAPLFSRPAAYAEFTTPLSDRAHAIQHHDPLDGLDDDDDPDAVGIMPVAQRSLWYPYDG